MSRLLADMTTMLPAMMGLCALAVAIAAAPANPQPQSPTGATENKPTYITAASAPRVRDIDLVLYRAHRQLPEAQSGCFDPGAADFVLQPGKFYPARRDSTMRSGGLRSF